MDETRNKISDLEIRWLTRRAEIENTITQIIQRIKYIEQIGEIQELIRISNDN